MGYPNCGLRSTCHAIVALSVLISERVGRGTWRRLRNCCKSALNFCQLLVWLKLDLKESSQCPATSHSWAANGIAASHTSGEYYQLLSDLPKCQPSSAWHLCFCCLSLGVKQASWDRSHCSPPLGKNHFWPFSLSLKLQDRLLLDCFSCRRQSGSADSPTTRRQDKSFN